MARLLDPSLGIDARVSTDAAVPVALVLVHPARITGVVRQADGAPCAAIEVHAQHAPSASTDAAGAFSLIVPVEAEPTALAVEVSELAFRVSAEVQVRSGARFDGVELGHVAVVGGRAERERAPAPLTRSRPLRRKTSTLVAAMRVAQRPLRYHRGAGRGSDLPMNTSTRSPRRRARVSVTLTACLLASCASLGGDERQLHATASPYDPLGPEEITAAVAAFRSDARCPADVRFQTVVLRQPHKGDAHAPGAAPHRQAFLVALDRPNGRTIEAVVDLAAPPAAAEVVDWRDVPGVHPGLLIDEYSEVPALVRADPRWQAAMQSAAA